MTDFPDVKLKALVSFPAAVNNGVGIDVVKQNGNYQFNLDFGDFAPPVGGIADPAHQNALLWNSITNSYVLAPVSLLGSAGAVPEAPNDGTQYGRQSLGWTPVVGGTGPQGPAGPQGPQGPAGSGSGNVTGPTGAVAGNIAVFNGTTGTIIQDGGQSIGSLIVSPATVAPSVDGTAAVGTSLLYARQDHIHPTDTSRAPLASPNFSGTPTVPTAAPGTNTTQAASTAFVAAAVSGSTAGVSSIGGQSGAITLNGGAMASTVLPSPRYDAVQTLTDDVFGVTPAMGQRSQARSNVYAAPFDALAYNGLQINGAM